MISVVMTTCNRAGITTRNLEMMSRQSLSPSEFELVLVNDGDDPIQFPNARTRSGKSIQVKIVNADHQGPAAARNMGARYADGEVILFTQDDCLMHRSLLYRHWLKHYEADKPISVQGYTDWWRDLPVLDFETFLYESGLQANWSSIKNPDGSWKSDATGFCLTTNFSIAKSEFERLGGFNEKFPYAAWEDVEFGYRGNKHGLTTIFEPNAVNHHAHRQTFDGYVKRNIKEGMSRIILVSLHPETSWGMLDPNTLRETNSDMLQEAITLAKELDYSHAPDVQKLRKERWGRSLQLASLEGIRQGLKAKQCRIWRAIPHLHLQDQCQHVVTAASRVEMGELAYAETSAEWALQSGLDNWALWMVRAEVSLAMGDRANALRYAMEGASRGAGEAWPQEVIKELS